MCVIWILCVDHVFGSPWLLSTSVCHASTSSSVRDASARGDRSASDSDRVHRASAGCVIRGTRVPVRKIEGSIEADCQVSLEMAQNPDGGPYPAFVSDKSWNEASGMTGSGKKFCHSVIWGIVSAAQPSCVAIGTPIIHLCVVVWKLMKIQQALDRIQSRLWLHRNKGDLQGFEFHHRQRPKKCHETQGRVQSRQASSNVGSGETTRVYSPMDLAYMCVKPQMRLYVCHQMRLLTQRSSLRSLTFARFARTFF